MMQNVATIVPLMQRIASVKTDFDEERVLKAYDWAREVYGQEMHRTGMTVLEHAAGVLEMLAPFEPDEDAIISCLLHHAVCKDGISLVELEERFGPRVRSLVSGVHLLSSISIEGRRNSIDDLRLMLLSVSDDVRTILITLCDRCLLLSDPEPLPPEEARSIASDVLQLYAPVAARLGIYSLKHDLEQRAFPVCYPADAERITEQLKQFREQHSSFLDRTTFSLQEYLGQRHMRADMEYREKEPYSIFRKMNTKGLTHISDVRDLFAVRVIVDATEDCYQTLGLLHNIGRPLSNRFKDFIAFPKPNGYQSLHTTLAQLPYAPKDVFMEVQVRTHKMHREAQYGIAAHWSYKEHGATRLAMEQTQLKKMLSMQEPVGEASEYSSLADHIFVLTPNGDIVELPEGATPLDFAFQVHTDLGLSFRSARVNGSIVPLDYELENGDVIEVLKFKTPKPSPQWMQLLKMSSSRSKLKRHLYALRRVEFIAHGRELVNAELTKHKLPPLDSDLSLLRMYDGGALSFARREDILMKIGQGADRASSLLVHLDALREHDFTPPPQIRKTPPRRQRKDALINLEAGLSMPTRFAKCCKPNEGEKMLIVGVINRSGEVMIHKKSCKMLRNVNPERRVKAEWR